jgi:2,3-dihydroxybenzoate-AMP ligase
VIPRSGKFLSLQDLLAFLTTKEIAKYKLPERLELMNDFPMSTFGKVSKKTLVEMVSEKIAKEHEPAPAAAQR